MDKRYEFYDEKSRIHTKNGILKKDIKILNPNTIKK